MKLRAILAVLFLLPMSLFADIEGTYRFFGTTTTGNKYDGTAIITRTGETFNADWSFSDGTTETGTGVVKEDFIAFHFHGPSDPTDSGVILYERHGGIWKGTFTLDGFTKVGKEKAIKIHDGDDHHHCHDGCSN